MKTLQELKNEVTNEKTKYNICFEENISNYEKIIKTALKKNESYAIIYCQGNTVYGHISSEEFTYLVFLSIKLKEFGYKTSVGSNYLLIYLN